MLDAAAVNDAAKALYERGETQRAIRALEEAAAGSPANTVLRRNLAEMYIGDAGRLFQVGEYDRAEPLLRRALELFPGDFRYLLRLAGTLNRLAREDEAIVAFRQVLEADADNAEARRGLATALNNRGVGKTAQGRWEEAYRDFDAALEAMPGLAGARENRAAALWNWAESSESTDHNQALDLYRKHAELEPDSAETYTRIGALLAAKRQDYAGALAAFLRAFEQRPGAPHTRRNLLIARHQYGVSLDQQGRYDDAIRQYEAALTLDPDYLDLYRSLGQTYRRSGRREQAAAAYLEILRREPTDAWAQEAIVALYVDAGNEAVRKGDIAAALAEFEQVPETARTAAIYGMLGYLYLAAKRPVDAMDALGRSLLLDPKDRTTRANFDLAAKAVRAEAERNPTPERTAARRRTDAYELAADVARRPRPQALARFASLLDRPPDDEATVRALQDCALAVVREAAPRYAEQAAAIGQKALALDAAHAGLKAWAAGLPPPTPAKP
jgi:tetratricopeptide (TPR) repeat protein